MSFEYRRKINYYETDMMGVVHHSNYIRFLEEARLYWLESIDLSMKTLEENQITIPVLEVNCKYKKHVSLGDVIIIKPYIEEFNGVRMTIKYDVRDEEKNIIIEAETKHCFTSKTLKPINLKKVNEEFYNKFLELEKVSYNH